MSPVSKYPVTLVTLFRLSHLSAAIEYATHHPTFEAPKRPQTHTRASNKPAE